MQELITKKKGGHMNLKAAGKYLNTDFDISLQVFLDEEGMPWFDATAICKALEYARDASDVVKKLDSDERRLIKKEDLNSTESVGFPNRGEKYFISEPGLYALIIGSEKPEAKKFKRWITHEVLPEIRKTGSYSIVKKNLTQKQIIVHMLLPELRPWEKRIPDYYQEAVCQMMHWGEYYPGRPLPDGMKWFNDRYIYRELPPGVREEINKRNPWKEELGRREHKNHQYFTDPALKHLEKQVSAIYCLIKASQYNHKHFKQLFHAAFPKDRYERLLEDSRAIEEAELILDQQVQFSFMLEN